MAAVPPPVVRVLASVPWALPALVLLAAAGFATPPAPLALASAAALLMALVVAGRRWARRLLPEAGATTRATAALVFATLGVVLPAVVLGHFGQLWARPFLVIVAGLTALISLAAGGPAAAGPVGSTPPDNVRRSEPAPAWRRTMRAVAFTAAGVAALAALHAERHQAPSKLDDPSYHLTAVAAWYHAGDLRMPKFGYGDKSTPFYPIGSELVDWALLAPLRSSDFVLRWSQLFYFAGTLIAAAAVARELGLGRSAATTAALLLLTVPRAFPGLALSAGNDHSTAFFAVAATAGALRLGHRPGSGAAVVTGAALGLLVGLKYLGLLLAPPLFALALLAIATAPSSDHGTRRGRLLTLVCVTAVVAGGYTYLRNAVSLGNPMFPAAIELFGFVLPGWQEASLEVRRQRPEGAIDPLRFLLDRSTFGPLVPFTALPAALLAPFVALAAPGTWPRRLQRTLVLLLPALFFLAFLFLVHDHRDIRYLFAAVALAAVAFAAGVEALSRRWTWIATVVEGGVATIVVLRFAQPEHRPPGGLAAFVLALVAAAVAASPAAGRLRHRLPSTAAAAAATVLVLASSAALAGELESYQRRKYRSHLLLEALEREAPEGAVIAYAGHNRPYPYFGARLEHRVEQVPIQGPASARYFTWGGDASLPWRRGRYWSWRRNLERLGITHVVLEQHAGRERRWIARHPEDFEPVSFFGASRLWRFTPAPATGPHEAAGEDG